MPRATCRSVAHLGGGGPCSRGHSLTRHCLLSVTQIAGRLPPLMSVGVRAVDRGGHHCGGGGGTGTAGARGTQGQTQHRRQRAAGKTCPTLHWWWCLHSKFHLNRANHTGKTSKRQPRAQASSSQLRESCSPPPSCGSGWPGAPTPQSLPETPKAPPTTPVKGEQTRPLPPVQGAPHTPTGWWHRQQGSWGDARLRGKRVWDSQGQTSFTSKASQNQQPGRKWQCQEAGSPAVTWLWGHTGLPKPTHLYF